MKPEDKREVFRRILGDKYLKCGIYLEALDQRRKPDWCSGWAEMGKKETICVNCALFLRDWEQWLHDGRLEGKCLI